MDNRLKHYLRKTRSLSPEIVVKKIFPRVKDKRLNAISKIFANVFGTETTDAGFLKTAWSSKSQFNNSEELQKHFRERKEPKLFIDSSKREDTISFPCECFSDTPEKIVSELTKFATTFLNFQEGDQLRFIQDESQRH